LRFRKEDINQLCQTMERDIRMLSKHNIMDYSLLFCVEENSEYKGKGGMGGKTLSSYSEEDDEDSDLQLKCNQLFNFFSD